MLLTMLSYMVALWSSAIHFSSYGLVPVMGKSSGSILESLLSWDSTQKWVKRALSESPFNDSMVLKSPPPPPPSKHTMALQRQTGLLPAGAHAWRISFNSPYVMQTLLCLATAKNELIPSLPTLYDPAMMKISEFYWNCIRNIPFFSSVGSFQAICRAPMGPPDSDGIHRN